jgi:type I restriction enzyme S subunit
MQRIRPTDEINSRFLHYFMNSSLAREQYNYQSTTTTGLANLNSEIIGNLRVPFIPLPEQQAIADFLDSKTAQLDDLIAKKQRQIDLLHEQRTALINQAVTKGLNPDALMKDSGVEWLGEIPSHWEAKKLKYVGQAVIGLTYSPENVTDEENGTLVFRASNVNGGKIVYGDNVFVNMEIPEHLITKVGDILICVRSGSRDLIGKNALIDENSAGHSFGAFMTVFRSNINNFLSYVFNSRLFKFQSGLFNTSTVNQLTQSSLYNFRVPVPPIDEQEKIIQFLNVELAQIDKTTNRLAKQIELLQEYRTALISAAVTGKIDVRGEAVHE